MSKVTSDQVADYILWTACQKGDLITNLKMQKLIYYAQAWYLALYGEPLFDAEFQAWVHGPVQPSLWRRFKDARWEPINCDPYYDEDSNAEIPEDVRDHLDEIITVFFDYSAYRLERMTHDEAPWQHARGILASDEPSTQVISHEDMKQYYSSLLAKSN